MSVQLPQDVDVAIADCKEVLGALAWECNGLVHEGVVYGADHYKCDYIRKGECWFRFWVKGVRRGERRDCQCPCHPF